MSVGSPYLYTLCQPGHEALLKAELAHAYPGLHLAFSRPGFVTWKNTAGILTLDTLPRLTFARRVGLCLGKTTTVEGLLPMLESLHEPLRLLVAPQTLHPWGHPAEEDGWKLAGTLEATLLNEPRLRGRWNGSSRAEAGDLVVEVLVPVPRPGAADPKMSSTGEAHTAPAQPFWVGLYRQPLPEIGRQVCPFAGAVWPLSPPADVPSRAWYKLEEARQTFAIPFQPGDTALELGSAPGGAARALLGLGVSVVGVDPDQMDPRVLAYRGPAHARLTHLRCNMGALRSEELPGRVDWLLLDANLAPQVALHGLHRLADRLRDELLGMILTLKLNEVELVTALPELLRRIKAMGVVEPLTTHLLANRQEVCVYGLTERGRRLRTIPPELVMQSTRPR